MCLNQLFGQAKGTWHGVKLGPKVLRLTGRQIVKESNLGGRIVGVEAVDKMTDRQIAAKVRKRFPKLDLPMGSNCNHQG